MAGWADALADADDDGATGAGNTLPLSPLAWEFCLPSSAMTRAGEAFASAAFVCVESVDFSTVDLPPPDFASAAFGFVAEDFASGLTGSGVTSACFVSDPRNPMESFSRLKKPPDDEPLSFVGASLVLALAFALATVVVEVARAADGAATGALVSGENDATVVTVPSGFFGNGSVACPGTVPGAR